MRSPKDLVTDSKVTGRARSEATASSVRTSSDTDSVEVMIISIGPGGSTFPGSRVVAAASSSQISQPLWMVADSTKYGGHRSLQEM
ncbi:hypothetical protein GCM10008096_01690 [Zhihengliuella salsuginis]|uniref:Uncharacterized protein n=1 Tax=Zhihengliuella salsuginis TaxID=578222 RepID=A0ABQ3GB33_9MICC|nr:hypothetical protein GCM10008096_01690 [Zhihengliuella salsuginis]